MTPAQRASILVQIAAASVSAERATGCPAEISAAQCIWESGWLQKLPPGSNNCFGIKDTDRYPGAVYTMTAEWRNGVLVPEKHAFEVYPTLADGFADHGRLITGGFATSNLYAPFWRQYVQDRDLDAWVRAFAVHYAPGNLQYAACILATAHSSEVENAVALARKSVVV